MQASELTFGVEIETTIPAGAIPVGQYHSNMQAQGLPEGWKAMRDGSIHTVPGREGCEFVSPILKGAEGVRSLLAAIEAIKALGGQVNATCGLHIHVGWTGGQAALARLVTLVANFEKGIYASTGTKSREQGRWCGGIQRHGNADQATTNASQYRYHVLNLTNLGTGRKNTVEFRAFAGTTNATKILGYVRLCLGLVERALTAKRPTNWTAKAPTESSPIKRGGEGQTNLNRLFYQLGWTKGRTNHTYGEVTTDDAPSLKEIKAEFMRLAAKYDQQP